MDKLSDTTNIGLTFQMTLDSFLEEQHSGKNANQKTYEQALHKLEEVKLCRSPQKKVAIALEARDICPDCIESYMTIGMYTQDIYERMRILKKGMELATMNLGKDFFMKETYDFYECAEAKPLLHIKFAYACTLFDAGYMKKAAKQFKELINLNPADVFSGVHYLYAIHLYFEELESCRELLHKYHKNDTFHTYAQFLYFIKSEEIEEAKAMIPKLKLKNRYLYDLLTFEAMNTASVAEQVLPGSEEEAGYIYRILSKVLHSLEYLHIFIVKNDEHS